LSCDSADMKAESIAWWYFDPRTYL